MSRAIRAATTGRCPRSAPRCRTSGRAPAASAPGTSCTADGPVRGGDPRRVPGGAGIPRDAPASSSSPATARRSGAAVLRDRAQASCSARGAASTARARGAVVEDGLDDPGCSATIRASRGCSVPWPRFHWQTPRLRPWSSKSPESAAKQSSGGSPVSNDPVSARQRRASERRVIAGGAIVVPGISARQVRGPTMPSTTRWDCRWNIRTAVSVPPPKTPSMGPM